jgi:hypothetical protein
MHESLRYLLEKVLSFYSKEEFYPVLLKAKEDYFIKTGKAFEEDEDYEARMASFNDWYVLQFLPDGSDSPLFEQYLEGHEILPELIEAIRQTNHSLFEYLGTSFRGVHQLKDILHDSKVILAKNHPAPSMVKGDLFIGRTTFYREEYYLYNGLRMMPKEAKSAMKKEAKKVRKSDEDHAELSYLLFTEALKTKWQRYGHIDIGKIFVFPDKRS